MGQLRVLLQETGILKTAGPSAWNRLLRAIGGLGNTPLFHMADENTGRTLAKARQVVSPMQLITSNPPIPEALNVMRSLPWRTYGSGTMRAPLSSLLMATQLHGMGPSEIKDLRSTLPTTRPGFTRDTGEGIGKYFPGRDLRTLSFFSARVHDNPKADILTKSITPMSIYTNAREPHSTYGPAGLVTSLRHGLRGGTPLADAGEWVSIHPRVFRDKMKGIMLELPRLQGTPIYDPAVVSRETGRMLRAEGAIPLNGRTRRMLKRINKAAPDLRRNGRRIRSVSAEMQPFVGHDVNIPQAAADVSFNSSRLYDIMARQDMNLADPKTISGYEGLLAALRGNNMRRVVDILRQNAISRGEAMTPEQRSELDAILQNIIAHSRALM